jgi:methane/ammonia monooxygenase subunit B
MTKKIASKLNSVIKYAVLVAVSFFAVAADGRITPAGAHGERAQEPYLRTRTVQWFDVKWSADGVKVGEDFKITGRFRLMEDWPDAVDRPDTVFLSVTSPGPALARVDSYINGVPSRQSARDLQLGRDYDFSIVMKGRVPGRHHIHPMISVHQAGPLVGPGKWIQVTGDLADFKYPLKTIDGREIEDLQTFGVANAVTWHAIWLGLAVVWLLWWLRRPLLIPRWIALQKGREDLLVTKGDMVFGIALGVVVIGTAAFGYLKALSDYPYTVPLQSGRVAVEPLPKESPAVEIKFGNATYDVPGRSMKVAFKVTNVSTKPITLGEFTTANLRFIDKSVPQAMAHLDPGFPKDLVAAAGLKTEGGKTLAPGETKDIHIEATDAAWELERLTSFLTDVDSQMGGMLVFYDDQGVRHLGEIGGPILPIFTSL